MYFIFKYLDSSVSARCANIFYIFNFNFSMNLLLVKVMMNSFVMDTCGCCVSRSSFAEFAEFCVCQCLTRLKINNNVILLKIKEFLFALDYPNNEWWLQQLNRKKNHMKSKRASFMSSQQPNASHTVLLSTNNNQIA